MRPLDQESRLQLFSDDLAVFFELVANLTSTRPRLLGSAATGTQHLLCILSERNRVLRIPLFLLHSVVRKLLLRNRCTSFSSNETAVENPFATYRRVPVAGW